MPARAKAPPSVALAVEALGDTRSMPDLEWLAGLLDLPASDIERTLREVGDYGGFESEIRRRHLSKGREFYAQLAAPFELYTLVRMLRPAHVIETGVSSGVSSAHILLALAKNRTGTLHSIDLPTRQKAELLAEKESPVCLPPGCETGWAVPEYLRGRWDLRIGPSQELLPKLVGELPSVELFLHDSLHTPAHLAFELDTVAGKLAAGSIVLADNTNWTGLSFDRFAARLGRPVLRRGDTGLVGLRVGSSAAQSPPTSPAPAKRVVKIARAKRPASPSASRRRGSPA
ncbi:MAG: class I SAM-dependent methyltransferase [Thermoplasmata archaeon]|nr:class I SAM-dependent methyltransferase [Thermoplasmata archaeon]